jgi:hypothetical protein
LIIPDFSAPTIELVPRSRLVNQDFSENLVSFLDNLQRNGESEMTFRPFADSDSSVSRLRLAHSDLDENFVSSLGNLQRNGESEMPDGRFVPALGAFGLENVSSGLFLVWLGNIWLGNIFLTYLHLDCNCGVEFVSGDH